MKSELGFRQKLNHKYNIKITNHIQGISSQTVESNLVMREGRTDISDILRHLFSRKFKPILISKLTFPKN